MTVPAVRGRTPFLAAGFIAAGFLVLYAATAGRTVILDAVDAAEFQAVGAAGGIPHQPYPLWCILAKTAALVPLGEPAFRVTFVSILFASLCVGALFVLLARRTGDVGASAAAVIAFGLSYTWWQNAVIAEVYALNGFLVVLTLLLVDRASADVARHLSFPIVLMLGFMLSELTVNVAVLPAVAVLLWFLYRREPRWPAARRLLTHALVFLFPFTLYLYTWLVDRGPFPMNWLDRLGQYYAQQQGMSAEQFEHFAHRMWLQLWPGRLHPDTPTAGTLLMNLYSWGKQFADAEFPLAGALFAVAGFAMLWRRDARAALILAVFGGAYLILVLVNIGGELFAHSIPVYMVCTWYIAVALAGLRRWTIARRRVGLPLYVIAAFVIVAMPFLRHLKASPLARLFRSPEHVAFVDSAPGAFVHLRANNRSGPAYAAAVEDVVPPGSIIFAGWTEANVLFYHQMVVGTLADIEVQYLLPTVEQVTTVIGAAHRTKVYLTRPPEQCGLESFRVRETINILTGRELKLVRNLYEVELP
jgi:hypothetical protein